MLHERLKAAHAVRDAYIPLKHAAAAMSGQALDCAQIMAAQRGAVKLKPGCGTDAIARIARAAALFAEAEQLIAGAHPELGLLIQETGLSRYYGYGYGDDDTPPPYTGAQQMPLLEEVARAA